MSKAVGNAMLAAAALTLATACGDDTGGPPPCLEDTECVPICEANCADDPVESAVCDEFLLTCVCECAP